MICQKENEATEELIRWTGMKHFEHKYMTQYSISLVEPDVQYKERIFLQQLMRAPIPQP